MFISGWKARDAAGLGVEDLFSVAASKIEGRWYFFFPKPGRPDISSGRAWNVPDDIKIAGSDFSIAKWDSKRIEKKIAKMMVQPDIAKRILDDVFAKGGK